MKSGQIVFIDSELQTGLIRTVGQKKLAIFDVADLRGITFDQLAVQTKVAYESVEHDGFEDATLVTLESMAESAAEISGRGWKEGVVANDTFLNTGWIRGPAKVLVSFVKDDVQPKSHFAQLATNVPVWYMDKEGAGVTRIATAVKVREVS